jgi:hypothetical protein
MSHKLTWVAALLANAQTWAGGHSSVIDGGLFSTQATEEDHDAPITHPLWKSKLEKPIHQHEAAFRSNGTHRGLLSRDHPSQCCVHFI